MVPDQMLRKYFEATERDASTSKSVCTSSKYSLSIKVFNAEMPLLTRLSEKRHLRGTSFQTLRDNNNRFKQLLSAVPSISIIQPLENVWLCFNRPHPASFRATHPGDRGLNSQTRKQHEQ